MNRVTRHFIWAASLVLLVSACTPPQSPVNNQQASHFVYPRSTVIPADPTNPQDSLAFIHEQACDYFINHVGSLAGTLTAEAIGDTIYPWIQSRGLSVDNYSHYLAFCDSAADPRTAYQVIDDFTSRGLFNSTQHDFLYQIQAATDSVSNHTWDSATFDGAIHLIEANIASTLTDSTNIVPFAMAAVARGSYYYWHAQSLNPSTAWPSSYFMGTEFKPKHFVPQGTAGKDAKGAVEGAGMYATVGIISFLAGGPLGTLAEMTLSSVVSAVVASLKK